MTEKTKNIISWSLTGVVGFIFMASAMSKLMGGNEALQMAQQIGLTPTSYKIIGVVELISVILFLVPRTGILGTLLLAAYMGGAIAVHTTRSMSILAPSLIQAFIWITAIVRFPELRSRLFNSL